MEWGTLYLSLLHRGSQAPPSSWEVTIWHGASGPCVQTRRLSVFDLLSEIDWLPSLLGQSYQMCLFLQVRRNCAQWVIYGAWVKCLWYQDPWIEVVPGRGQNAWEDGLKENVHRKNGFVKPSLFPNMEQGFWCPRRTDTTSCLCDAQAHTHPH